ncbi:hypothetical protein BKA67DRAFT_307894 [Truncatella angustata]|uniref:ubiquitinyl hydrolase 1 n=1 Tax=Truncatella angustata TaxID=152316 RepID=A0A9P8UJ33_9PEZI|nr:uncharacterized protein BKA67DRAFT_307894 [Truncatella angustata]KAH6653039.1 hypothetical protein BKA67DRAFT_307894 [Truncatella angustata]KAH8194978.1 hypothetical protein TruAng_010849 [Truncatella angustata]
MISSSWSLPRSETAETAARLLENSDSNSEDAGKVFTSARLINRLLSGDILRPGQEACRPEGHQLQLLPSQTGKTGWGSTEEFLSCVCDQCLHHFRFKVTNGPNPSPLENYHKMKMHMFLLTGRDSDTMLKATRTKQDHVTDRVHFMCIIDGCDCKLQIERLPPRISAKEFNTLMDESRLVENIREARLQDADRIDSLLTKWNPNAEGVVGMLCQYLVDGIQEPRLIKTHNKKFMIAFKDDFDDLWRTLGCTKKTLKTEGEPDEEAWQFPSLGVPVSPTAFGTLRAKWEDFEAECMIYYKQAQTLKDGQRTYKEIATPRRTRPAFELLKRLLGCQYEPLDNNPSLNEEDLVLLGCLANFKPSLYADAAKILVQKCPMRWQEFLDAGGRLIGEQNSDVAFDLMVFRSEVESKPKPLDAQTMVEVVEAYKYLGADLDQKSADYFIEKYLNQTSEAGKDVAIHHLAKIGKYLDKDLLTPVGAGGGVTSKMTRVQAADILGADIEYPHDLLQQLVNNKAQDPTVDRAKVAEALEVLADHARTLNVDLADKLNNWAGLFKASDEPGHRGASHQPAQEQPSDTSTPPGLGNIGNTCYLNSLLQYIYTITPLRDLVLRYPQDSLNLSVESVAQRKLGYGNGIEVSLDEAIVGKIFVELLQSLFRDLLTTTAVEVRPPQKLANTALRSASELLKMPLQQPDTKPPPLPARPSPAPPQATSADTNNVNVTVEPVNESLETASIVSSQTLVDDEGPAIPEIQNEDHQLDDMSQDAKPALLDGDTPMVDVNSSADTPPKELSLEQKIEVISHRLEQSERQGTEQQDVEEIIGFILEHLMRAISSSGPMPGKEDLQSDTITKTFFPLIVNYTVNKMAESNEEAYKSARQELIPDRWINAFPAEKPGVSSTIHDALSRSFGIQFVADSDLGRFSTIRQLSPIVHIRIQRANATSSGATKNSNPVRLTDELFFDRYMDAQHDSELAQQRQKLWCLQGHDKGLEESNRDTGTFPVQTQPTIVNDDGEDLSTGQYLDSDDEMVEAILQELPLRSSASILSEKRKSDSQPTNETDFHATKKRSLTPSTTASLMQAATLLLNGASINGVQDTKSLGDSKESYEKYFDGLTEHKYRLHAVICHSGGARAGHYWVWIRDFRRNRWIKFNDGRVTIDPRRPEEVIDQLNESGDPCYVAYVRDNDKDNLVGIPERTPMVAQSNGREATMEVIEGVAPQDTDMPDLFPVGKHIATENGIVETQESRPYELF